MLYNSFLDQFDRFSLAQKSYPSDHRDFRLIQLSLKADSFSLQSNSLKFTTFSTASIWTIVNLFWIWLFLLHKF